MRASGALLSPAAQRRIVGLAEQTAVHRAFSWLHLHQPQIQQWLLELVRIPAPTFAEEERARWYAERFRELGLLRVTIDAVGNVLGEIGPADEGSAHGPALLLSAHLDTVFPAGVSCEPRVDDATGRIYAPGAADNGAGLSALLALAAALRFAEISPPVTVLFVANVGEEGEGDLRGMRHLFQVGEYAGRIRAAIALEGAGTATVVNRALGSRRLRIAVSTAGGHSWTDADTPNAIVLLAAAITRLAQIELPKEPRTTLNVGRIEGGTSVNTVAADASALLDIRSTDGTQLVLTEAAAEREIRAALAAAKQLATLAIEVVGDRPAGTLPQDAELLQTIRAVDRHLGLRTELRVGSTDANLPLSLGVPAVAMSAGGTGGGMHTLGEWYESAGRETALRRLLLTVLDTAQVLAAGVALPSGAPERDRLRV